MRQGCWWWIPRPTACLKSSTLHLPRLTWKVQKHFLSSARGAAPHWHVSIWLHCSQQGANLSTMYRCTISFVPYNRGLCGRPDPRESQISNVLEWQPEIPDSLELLLTLYTSGDRHRHQGTRFRYFYFYFWLDVPKKCNSLGIGWEALGSRRWKVHD